MRLNKEISHEKDEGAAIFYLYLPTDIWEHAPED